MKRTICAALALVFLLTLCACGKTGTGSGSAVGGTSSAENIFEQLVREKDNAENIFEQLVQEKVNIEDFSCKKAYTAAKKCLEKQDYDNAAVWFYIAQEAGRRTRDDEGCTQDARQMYEAMLGQDDAAAWMFVITARELDMELDWDGAAEYNEMLNAVPEDAGEKAGQIIMLADTKLYRLEQAKQYGTLSVASVPLRRWEEDGFAPAEPLRPGETELELTWEDDGRRASPDGTWEEIWYGDSVAKITRTDLEGNTIVTEYYEGEPETTEESDALGRVHIRTNHRTDLCGIYWYAYALYVPDTYPSSWEPDRFTHQYWFDLDGQLSFEYFYNEDGTECTEALFYKNGEPSYRCVAVYDENGERTGGIRYINAKTGEEFDPDTDGYPD